MNRAGGFSNSPSQQFLKVEKMNATKVYDYVSEAFRISQQDEPEVADVQGQLILALLELRPPSAPSTATERRRHNAEIRRVDNVASDYTRAQIIR